ncbi:MAG TPA: energy-coupling factor transporter ATPase [Clostridiales bacterium]|nr:energy-coupling factor transporter ATPase [Clostridiales bacterium]
MNNNNITMIQAKDVYFYYKALTEDSENVEAINGVNLQVKKGEFLVLLGRNGSGKSTLCRLFNALLKPKMGTVVVNGFDTLNEDNTWLIRKDVGMVFQNPDNQIVGNVVEEDVAFGPENLGVPPAEIRKRVDQSLKTVGMSEYAELAPHRLSGGQKQKVAIAGILAMEPECIILDEATSMLDPWGRKEVLDVLLELNKKEGITVIHVTHHMEEACLADRVAVVDDGRIIKEGSPAEIFSDVEGIKGMGLDVPQVTEVFYKLNQKGYRFPTDILTVEDALKVIKEQLAVKRIGN